MALFYRPITPMIITTDEKIEYDTYRRLSDARKSRPNLLDVVDTHKMTMEEYHAPSIEDEINQQHSATSISNIRASRVSAISK